MENNKSIGNTRPYRTPYNRTTPMSYTNIPYKHTENFVVGMAYVPWQTWNNIYDPGKGFCRGTIFQDLDKPFEGGHCR